MELELAIFGQVTVFLAISLGTMMAATAPRQVHPVARDALRGVTSDVPKHGI